MKNEIDWKAEKIDWAGMTDTEIAASRGITRAAASAARKRLGAPASPAGHGGQRRGEAEGATLTLRPTAPQKRRWAAAAKAAGMPLREWAQVQLDSANNQGDA